jgi:hypothetical protein
MNQSIKMYSERIPRGLATGFFFDLNVGSFYFEFKDTFYTKNKITSYEA